MGAFRDLAGQRFGRLVVKIREGSKNGGPLWLCLCDCGKQTTVPGESLRKGKTKSCGCGMGYRKHGHTDKSGWISPTYSSYRSMIGRCSYASVNGSERYKGRGITVCDRWINGDGTRGGFECFLADMGERPEGMTLDRYPHQSGFYQPDNCRWATLRQQANNRSTNRLFEINGQMLSVSEIARRSGVGDSTLRERLKRGWTIDEAMSGSRAA